MQTYTNIGLILALHQKFVDSNDTHIIEFGELYHYESVKDRTLVGSISQPHQSLSPPTMQPRKPPKYQMEVHTSTVAVMKTPNVKVTLAFFLTLICDPQRV